MPNNQKKKTVLSILVTGSLYLQVLHDDSSEISKLCTDFNASYSINRECPPPNQCSNVLTCHQVEWLKRVDVVYESSFALSTDTYHRRNNLTILSGEQLQILDLKQRSYEYLPNKFKIHLRKF